MTFATIDIGSNTTLLLIMAREGDTFKVLCDEIYFTRLAEGIWETGEFNESALIRLEKAFQSIKSHLEAFKTGQAYAVATSASRQAKNQSRLFQLAEKYGINSMEVISPKREAELTFLGSLFGLGHEFQNPLVVDIGGGSTELVSSRKSYSLNMGSVSLTEKFLSVNPLTRIEKLGLLNYINRQLEPLKDFLKDTYDGVVFTAGTPVSLSFMENETEDANKIHGIAFQTDRVNFWFDRLSSLSLEERKQVPFLPKHRVDVIVSGVAILKQILALIGKKNFIVSATGVRYGLILEQFQ